MQRDQLLFCVCVAVHWRCHSFCCFQHLISRGGLPTVCELHIKNVELTQERLRLWCCQLCRRSSTTHASGLVTVVFPALLSVFNSHIFTAHKSTLVWSASTSDAAWAWNALPASLRTAESYIVFWRQIKTLLFQASFSDDQHDCAVVTVAVTADMWYVTLLFVQWPHSILLIVSL